MKIAACQMPDLRESIDASLSLIEQYADHAWADGVRLICFPECFLQGYMVEKEKAAQHAICLQSAAFDGVLARLAGAKPMLVFGIIEADGGSLYNTAVVVEQGRLFGRYRKTNLLAGERAFSQGCSYPVFNVDGFMFGINICSDTQTAVAASAVAAQGAKLIVCPANNMMTREKSEKWKDRHNECRASRARETGLWLMSSDVTGSHGDSVSLGPTCVINPQGNVVAQVPSLEVGMVVAEIE